MRVPRSLTVYGSKQDQRSVAERELQLDDLKNEPPISQSSRKSMGMPDQDNLQRIISPIGEKCNYLGWRILSYADLRDRSDHEQPPANSGVLK